MPLEPYIKEGIEELLFASDSIALGKFRINASHPSFEDTGAPHDNAIVFPRRMIRIEHVNGPAFVADPTIVPLYNRGQRFTRHAISNEDHADWIVVADDILAEIAGAPAFRAPFALSDSVTFLAQRRIFDALLRGEPVDALRIEETMLGVAARVLRRPIDVAPRRTDVAIVERIKKIIAADVAKNHSLRHLAMTAEVTPFRLCRLFKAVAGVTLTEYRHSLRLRAALPRIRKSDDLAALAAELGYASHSHFTAVFR
ncbi:MAG TPA: AraC family transcriptional regulator, partial [Thermoanaerobaculia bacterium]